MDKIQLKVLTRDVKALTPNKIRKAGQIPAVLYGHNIPTVALIVNFGEFEKVFKKAGESTIVELVTEDGKTHPVLVHDVQHHYLTTNPIHVDFYEVSMTEKLKAAVVLEFTGESEAVKALGGTMVKILNEVEVECLPADLPHNIEVDISSLKTFSDTIHVRSLKVSSKVTIVTDPEETIAKVQPPRDVEAELTGPVVEDISAVVGAAEEKPAAAGEEKAEGQKE